MVLTHIIYFLVGLALLVKGAAILVETASKLAKRLGVSEFIIGLTIVSLGTTIPELASSVAASLLKQGDIITGTVIGSNIANIGLIVGIIASIAIIKTNKTMLKRDGYIMIFASIIAFLFMMNGIVSPIEGLVLLLLYIAYFLFLLESRKKLKEMHFKEFLDYFMKLKYLITIKDLAINQISNGKKYIGKDIHKKLYNAFKEGLIRDFIIIALCSIAVVFGANFTVRETIWFAGFLKIPESLIAMTVIAVGTSLPELTVAITAAKKGFTSISMGNIIGANIANLLLIFGISAIINPIQVNKFMIFFAAPFMLISSSAFLLFIRSHGEIKKTHGAALLGLYAIFLTVSILFSINFM